MERDSTTHGIHHAGKLGQQSVSRRLYDPASVLGDARFDQFGEVGGQCRERSLLVFAHEPGVAHHVGGEDCGEAALDDHYALLRQAGFAEAIDQSGYG